MKLIVVDDNASAIDELRHRFASSNQYGTRATCIHADPAQDALPPYLADLVVVANGHIPDNAAAWTSALRILRPYGGTLVSWASGEQAERLGTVLREREFAGCNLSQDGNTLVLTREGALPGAADWTHEYGDSSNTLMSHDRRVRAPFGVLWFGGPASHGDCFTIDIFGDRDSPLSKVGCSYKAPNVWLRSTSIQAESCGKKKIGPGAGQVDVETSSKTRSPVSILSPRKTRSTWSIQRFVWYWIPKRATR